MLTSKLYPNLTHEGYPLQDGVFGMNIEITRKGVFGGLSAQMLNNRKMFMGTEGVDGWICQNAQRVLDRPHESLCQSHFVVLKNGIMSQTSETIATQSGQMYEAVVWVKAYDHTAKVTFGLEGREYTATISPDDAPYVALTYEFEGEDVSNGTFFVKVQGEVAVYEASLMPKEHYYGMRWDVIEKLKYLAPTSLRFPGGCAADHFEWRESLKAPEFRKPVDGRSKDFLFRDSYHQDTQDIGLNEFFMLCKILDAEPEYTVSLILSDGEDAKALVEYCNGDASTPYGEKRKALGFEAFGVHLWYIGNEAYFFGGAYQNSVVAARRTDELISAMKQADPTISVAIGLTWGYHYQTWAFEFMENLKSDFDYVSYHDYIGILPDATQGENGMATCEILERNFADGECFGLNFYRNQLYVQNFDTIKICVDEWNYSWGKDSSNALFFSNALQCHFLLKSYETYHVHRAEFFMPVNEGMITVRGNLCKTESTGEMFHLMAGHRGGRVIDCASSHDMQDVLDVLCTDHGAYLYVSVVNRYDEACDLEVEGYTVVESTEIKVHDFSFNSNDYEILRGQRTQVSGHSVLFMKLAR